MKARLYLLGESMSVKYACCVINTRTYLFALAWLRHLPLLGGFRLTKGLALYCASGCYVTISEDGDAVLDKPIVEPIDMDQVNPDMPTDLLTCKAWSKPDEGHACVYTPGEGSRA